MQRSGLRTLWIDSRRGPWADVAQAYEQQLKPANLLGTFIGFSGRPHGEHFSYPGGETPSVIPAYNLRHNNSQLIIDHILQRQVGKLQIDVGGPFDSTNRPVIADPDALGGIAMQLLPDGSGFQLVLGGLSAHLVPGDYVASFRLKVLNNQPTTTIANVYAFQTPTYGAADYEIIENLVIQANDFVSSGSYQDFEIGFNLDDFEQEIDFRVDYFGGDQFTSSVELRIDQVIVTRNGVPALPVMAPIFIPLVTPDPQNLNMLPGFADDFVAAGGIVLQPDEYMAMLNPSYMIELAVSILGPNHVDVISALALLEGGDPLTSLLLIRASLTSFLGVPKYAH